MKLSFLEVRHDAELLREYITGKYGRVLSIGGWYESYQRAIHLCRRLAALTGDPLDLVIQTIRADWEASEGTHGQ